MKNKDFTTLIQRILPNLPRFVLKVPLMLLPPMDHTLRAIYFESHSYETRLFYVWVFYLPLFVPRKHVSFEFGKRIGGNPWHADDPNLVQELGEALKREALPFLAPIKSPLDVAYAVQKLNLPQNPHIQEATAYALARAGDADKALTEIDTLLAMLDAKISWQFEIAERAHSLKSLLTSDLNGAQKQLEDWEVESIRNLGLEKFR